MFGATALDSNEPGAILAAADLAGWYRQQRRPLTLCNEHLVRVGAASTRYGRQVVLRPAFVRSDRTDGRSVPASGFRTRRPAAGSADEGQPYLKHPPTKPGGGGSLVDVARARTVAGYAIPGIVVFFLWVIVAILAIILLAYIVHWAGGGVLNLRLGHFVLNVGFS